MRTTVSISPESAKLINRYVEALDHRMGPRVSVSTAVEEALTIALPLMVERMPKKDETSHDFLLRCATGIMRKLQNDNLTKEETNILMREAIRFQNDCNALLLTKKKSNTIDEIGAYNECTQAFMNAYSIGAERLKKL